MISPDEMDEDFGGPLDPSTPRSSSASERATGDAQEAHLQDKEDRLAAMEERLKLIEDALGQRVINGCTSLATIEDLDQHEEDHHRFENLVQCGDVERAIESHEAEYHS